jgi:hypothetical protein
MSMSGAERQSSGQVMFNCPDTLKTNKTEKVIKTVKKFIVFD